MAYIENTQQKISVLIITGLANTQKKKQKKKKQKKKQMSLYMYFCIYTLPVLKYQEIAYILYMYM